ncbi:pyochelin synthetase [Ruminiclostridium sufflavum DSM 19573]|uniref:Pyochelin synthetase n=1 Tax=Ruminiclostridium sufflavum DSM 19573 TaxID=1121337 RepID=A0A318XRU7_9FIRM|nr:non-ribosomal peptide synthetase [Ruminiclostridium sufflavum]PYG89174.1 pyochelin synthetase [Ruminiclostridium sufflavum DSM 19573]
MSAEEIIEKYENSGVKIWVEDNNLKFRAPKNALTDENKKELKLYKEAIITYLSNINQNVVIADNNNRYNIFPLTDIQSAYLMGRDSSYKLGGVSCHAYGELKMEAIDKERLEFAWHKLIMRHDMLRVIVYPEGYQCVQESVALPEIKTYKVNDSDAGHQISEVRRELSNKQYRAGEWPLYELVLTNTDTSSILHFSIDMLIGDFVSVNIILEELMHYYNKPEDELPELDISFRDIMLFRQARKKSFQERKRIEEDKDYWLGRIADLPGAPELNISRDISNHNVEFEQKSFVISNSKWKALKEGAEKNRVTPSSVILSAYSEVLRKWSKTKVFCINLTILNRPDIHPQIGRIVGDFTDTNVLEVDWQKDASFLQKTRALQNRLWTDLGHSSFSGVEVLREMARCKKKNVIIPIVFTSTLGMNAHSGEQGNIDIKYKISQTPQVYIDCQVSDIQGGVLVNWDIRKGIFEGKIIEDMFNALKRLLEDIAENNAIWDCVSVVKAPPGDIGLFNKVNDTNGKVSEDLLFDAFIRNVSRFPQKTALITDKENCSYKDLLERSVKIQNYLIKEGCKPDDKVAVVLKRGIVQIASVMGTIMSGGVYVPVDYGQPAARKLSIAEDSGARFIITDNENKGLFEKDGVKEIIAEELVRKAGKVQRQELAVNNDNSAYIIYTSGSTGKAKGVEISHKSAVNTIYDINERFNITENDVFFYLANIAFDLSVYDIFGSLSSGGTLVIPSEEAKGDSSYWLSLIRRNKITVWNSVPAHMQMLVTCYSSDTAEAKLSLRLVLLSGDWIPVNLPEKVREMCTEAEVISLGGATEASIWSIYYPTRLITDEDKSVPYGFPLKNQQFYVFDDSLEYCPVGVTGDLYIGGIGLAKGYYGDKEKTDLQFIRRPDSGEIVYKTGDLGRYRQDGSIEFLGREDTQVKIHGYRIELREIENAIKEHPAIENAMVLMSKKDNEYQLNAFAVPKESEKIPKPDYSQISELCTQTGQMMVSEFDDNLLIRWMELSEKISLLNILGAFRTAGLFIDKEALHTQGEIEKAIYADPKYIPLLRRWLNALCKEEILEYDFSISAFRLINEKELSKLPDLKNTLEDTEDKLHNSKILTDYLNNPHELILKLISGKENPLDYIFPEGRLENAMSAYHDNLFAKSLNRVAIEAIMKLVRQYSEKNNGNPVRILEVGAGIGGTSIDLIPLLDRHKVEYRFTDISMFFLNAAKERFEKYSWIGYGLFDINTPFLHQNMTANSWDIILCANVLHNAADGQACISMLSEMITPNGALVVIDSIKEPYSLLTSMGFEYTIPVTDYRLEAEQVFFDYPHWLEMFRCGGFNIAGEFPLIDAPLSNSGQHIFVGIKASDSVKVYPDQIKKFLLEKIPHYMVPARIEILGKLPITGNGKIDRKKLSERIVFKGNIQTEDDRLPASEFEKGIAAIWAEVLNLERVGLNQNFYEIGGDSLLIAQAIAKMKKNIPEISNIEWKTLMKHMIEKPTVSDFAKSIETGCERVCSIDEYKLIREEAVKCGKEIVLFPDGTGTISIYKEFIGKLSEIADKSIRISGFNIENTEEYLNYEPSSLIKSLGKKYAERLMQNMPDKLYLIGHCMGGLIAFETARSLKEQGFSNFTVSMIDSKAGGRYIDNELLLERGFGKLLTADISQAGHYPDDYLLRDAIDEYLRNEGTLISEEQLCNLGGKYEDIGKSYADLSAFSQKERLKSLYTTLPGIDKNNISEYEADRIYNYYRVFCHSYKSVIGYTPEKYDGKVYMFKCEDQSTGFLPFQRDNNMKFIYEAVQKEIDETIIKGDHISCMYGSHVSDLIKRMLEKGLKDDEK